MMPSLVEFQSVQHLFYAGTANDDFAIGHASRITGTSDWVRDPVPLFATDSSSPPEWRQFAQNTPEALVVDDELWLYYTGRSAEEGGLSIGLARSQDGSNFSEEPSNPVLAPSGTPDQFDAESVAHPSVLMRDGLFEMWFASGTLEIGYALSANGIDWEKYCRNPVFSGVSSSWDRGKVKAPEVVLYNDTYWMTYSGCGQGCYEVGWATSTDGTHWVTNSSPWLERTDPPAWNSYGIQAAFINDNQTPWEIWYTGTGNDSGQIGTLQLDSPPQ